MMFCMVVFVRFQSYMPCCDRIRELDCAMTRADKTGADLGLIGMLTVQYCPSLEVDFRHSNLEYHTYLMLMQLMIKTPNILSCKQKKGNRFWEKEALEGQELHWETLEK